MDPDFYKSIIEMDKTVYAVPTSRFTVYPGTIHFQEILTSNSAIPWLEKELEITKIQYGDLNGDGQLECILDLSNVAGDCARIFLSEQDGVVYAYYQYFVDVDSDLSVDKDGNLLCRTSSAMELLRLVFDQEQCLLLTLPDNLIPAA